MTIADVLNAEFELANHVREGNSVNTDFYRKLSNYAEAVRGLALEDAFDAVDHERSRTNWMVER